MNFVLNKLEKNPRAQYKKNEIFLMCRSSFFHIKLTTDIEPIIEILIQYNYLEEIPPTRTIGKQGRNSAFIYKLNPLHFKF